MHSSAIRCLVLYGVAAAAIGMAGASAQPTLTYKIMTGQPWNGTCDRSYYMPTFSFAPSSQSANVYFELSGIRVDDALTNVWIQPDGMIYSSGYWSTGLSGNHCYEASLQIAGSAVTSQSGAWHAQVSLNGTTLFDLAFTIGTATGNGPSYTGSFDPIPSDCSHLFGWAMDSNNPGAAIKVDISVSGYPQLTVTADQPRSDLTGTLANHA